jgi:hypothetical protein
LSCATRRARSARRLISDVAGISLAEHESDADIPSYRTFDFLDLAKVQAALGRRVFEAGPVAESVDYAHRTTAEFLGAAWLAATVRGGLPLRRVQALIGVEGHPAPELRGLHAWLALSLPEHADRLIEADPYGVLSYSDAGCLPPSSRRLLLDALGRLSQTDPWFRSGRWQSPAIGALAKPDMVDALRAVLNCPTANFGLRSVVVDALAMGTPLPAMGADLASVLTRRASPFADRLHALEALLHLGADGEALVLQAYRERLGQDDSSIRLRGEILAQLYGHGFGPADVAQLMEDTQTAKQQVTTGALWSISESLPIGEIPAVLDRWLPIERQKRSNLEQRNVWEFASTFEHLLLRVLKEGKPAPHEGAVWRWLRVLASFRDTYGAVRAESLRETLRQKPELLRRLADHFFQTVELNPNRWLAYSEFREATGHAIDWEQLLEWIVAYLRQSDRGSERERFLYELALNLIFNTSSKAHEIFAELYDWGDARADLRPVRDGMMSCTMRLERGTRHSDQEEETETKESRRRNFEANSATIRSGAHLGWLAWAAHVYYGLFSDLDENATPPDRLIGLLGEANTNIVIEGFIATLQRPDIPTLERVAATSANHRISEWWYALIAGLDERWRLTPGFDGLSDDLLRAALAIEQAYPIFITGKTTSKRWPHDWKTTVLRERPELARDAYLALARAAFGKGKQHVEGLRELLNDVPFAPFRAEVTLDLLGEFPNAAPFRLYELLRSGLGPPVAHPELLTRAREILSRSGYLDLEQRDLWLASAYFLWPHEFERKIEAEAQQRPNLIFHLRDLAGHERHGDGLQPLPLTVTQLEFLARLTGNLFPETAFPTTGWSGNTNLCDASEFVRHLVNVLSAVPTQAATAALVRLESDNGLASYRPHILHGLANQRNRRREADYDRPDWLQTLQALANGPPANVSDLHALFVTHLDDLKQRIASANTDIYKWFWNEDGYGRITAPKPEESCRDILVDLLRLALSPLGVTVEPEGHMVSNKRADISVAMPGRKILCELKRDYHAEVWRAAEEQLDRFYTIDPEAKGFGVYGVFWFGQARPSPIPTPPDGLPPPQSAAEMEERLADLIPKEKQGRLAAVVLDVSGVL